jgi:hypothetical protein
VRFIGAILLAAACTLVRAGEADTSAERSGKTASGEPSAITLHRSACPCGNCCVAVTPNFRIFWCTTENDLRELAERCERLAAASKESWLGKQPFRPWVPKCDVVVHPHVAEYVQALGPGSQQTSGCATIQLDQGRVVARRIDFRADAADWETETLPHELTHVVLADRSCRSHISPWADEGIAMLAESPAQLKRRLNDLRQIAADRSIYTARDLINVTSSPEPAFRAAFYGQSLALVSLFLDWGSREQLLQFVEASQLKGLDAALRDVYGDHSAAKLERQFRDYLLTDRPLTWSQQNFIAAAIRTRGGAIPE